MAYCDFSMKVDAQKKKEKKAELAERLKDEGAAEQWVSDELLPWRANKHNQHATQQWSIDAKKGSGHRAERVGPVFWETALYKKHHEGEVHPDMIKPYTFQGKRLQGVFADDDGRPLPTGAIRLSDFDTEAVEQSAEVEKASECFRAG